MGNAKRLSASQSVVRQLIIQCPACQTKFALDSSVLEGVEDPRFHCSRCDNLFSLEESKRAAPVAIRDEEAGRKTTEMQPWRAENAGGGRSRKLEIPSAIDPAFSSTPPHESVNEEPALAATAQITFPFVPPAGSDSRTQENVRPEFAPSVEPLPAPEPANDSVENRSDTDFFYQPAPPAEDRSFDRPSPTVEFGPPQERESSPWIGLLLLSIPLILFLALLIGTSLYLRSSPSAAQSFLNTFFPAAPKVAPQGLYIGNSRIQKVVLDSGDSILLISGRIANKTGANFSEIILEGIVFDGDGRPLYRAKVNSGATLARSRVRSLTPEMIAAMQKTAVSKTGLKNGASQEFAVALGVGQSAQELDKAKHFLARVYSVRE